MKKRCKNLLIIAVVGAMTAGGFPFGITGFAAEEQSAVITEEEATEEDVLPIQEDALPIQEDALPTEEEQTSEDVPEERIRIAVNGIPEYEESPVTVDVDPELAEAGQTVTVTASDVDGFYLAQIRIGRKIASEEESEEGDMPEASDGSSDTRDMVWETLEVSGNQAQFVMPEGSVTVYGDYISVVWDGTIDLTWYDEDENTFDLQYGAQLAGAAALANGLFNDFPEREETVEAGTEDEEVILYPDVVDEQGDPILGVDDPETTEEISEDGSKTQVPIIGYVNHDTNSGYEVFEDVDGDGLDTPVCGDLNLIRIQRYTGTTGGNNRVTTLIRWLGSEDFLGKTICLANDLDMGGICAEGESPQLPASWSGPNYMPVGGQYAMDVGHGTKKENGYTCLSSYFRGDFDGKGHMVRNICALRHVSSGVFGNCQSVGLIGVLGHPNASCATGTCVVENVAVTGMIYGNRSIGGVVGKTDLADSCEVKNCMNFATVYNTDAKGCGGIIGAGWNNPVVENCANFGLVCTAYDKNAGGLIGSSEAVIFDSYSVGYAAGEGTGKGDAGQAFGTNNGGAVWYNCYALKGGGSGTTNKPGVATETVWGQTFGSAIRVLDSAYDMKTDTFLALLNGRVKNNGPDENGYMDSDDDVVWGVKRNWVAGTEKAGSVEFISPHLAEALAGVCSWHDPEVTITDQSLSGIVSALTAVDATGMPVPRTFVHDSASVTGLTTTGVPTLSYYTGEAFETGDHDNPSTSPAETDPEAEFAVWALFDDGTWQEIEDYEVIYPNGSDAFEAGDTGVTIHASYLGKEMERSFSVEVTPCALLNLKVSKVPQNQFYSMGETFDPNGMIVTADYGVLSEDGSNVIIMTIMAQYLDDRITLIRKKRSKAISDQSYVWTDTELTGEAASAYVFTISPNRELEAEDEKITVTHQFNDVVLEASTPITVTDSEAPYMTKDSFVRTVYIRSANDFLWYANQISADLYPTINGVLETDITLSNPAFNAIGSTNYITYQGTLDGRGHSITINTSLPGSAGLFYSLGDQSTVKNLVIEGNVSGRNYTGSIATYLDGGTITNCINHANVTGSSYVGGLVGYVRDSGGMICECENSGSVTGSGSYIGGIAGRAMAGSGALQMEHCTNLLTGTVTGAEDAIGGLIGELNSPDGTVLACANYADVRRINENPGVSECAVGGLAGTIKSCSVFSDSRNTGDVTGAGYAAAGGIAGKMESSQCVKSVYNTGKVSAVNPSASGTKGGLGGIAGRTAAKAEIAHCYNTGSISPVFEDETKTYAYAGALIGNAKDVSQISNNAALAEAAEKLIGPDKNVTEETAAFLSKEALMTAAENYFEEGSGYENRPDCYPALINLEAADHVRITEKIVTKEPTCAEEGSYYPEDVCVVCGEVFAKGEEQVIPRTEHVWDTKTEHVTPATGQAHGLDEEVVYCTVCGEEKSRTEVIVHVPGDPEITDRKEATCEEEGSYMETVKCLICGELIRTEKKTIPATSHTFGNWAVKKEATCTEAGYRERYCTVCYQASEKEVIPATGHDFGEWEWVSSVTHKRVCSHDDSHVETAVHTQGEAVTENDTDGTYDRVVYCTDCHGELSRKTYQRFKDVNDPELFYYDAVYWAVEQGITTGWTDHTFRPLNQCNRAAVVTFLWRLGGKPEPSEIADFKDMPDDTEANQDFRKAISWAAENGITTGYDGNVFKPWASCNRAAIVTFLWRYANKPEAAKAAGFADMTGNSDFDSAISWAAENGITTGWEADNTFRPWNTCNRLAVVSFLYRLSDNL